MYDKDWGYVLSSEPQTLQQCLNFYRCHSTSTNQQAGDEIGRENLEYIYNFLVSLQRKNTRASSFTVASQFYARVDVELFIHIFMHLREWRKTGMLNIIRLNFSLRPRLLASYSGLYNILVVSYYFG